MALTEEKSSKEIAFYQVKLLLLLVIKMMNGYYSCTASNVR